MHLGRYYGVTKRARFFGTGEWDDTVDLSLLLTLFALPF